jgi:hypothetical protein
MIKSMFQNKPDALQGQQLSVRNRESSRQASNSDRAGFRDEIQKAHRKSDRRENPSSEVRRKSPESDQKHDQRVADTGQNESERNRPNQRGQKPVAAADKRLTVKKNRPEEATDKKLANIKEKLKKILSKQGADGQSKDLEKLLSKLENIEERLKKLLDKAGSEGTKQLSNLLDGVEQLTKGLEQFVKSNSTETEKQSLSELVKNLKETSSSQSIDNKESSRRDVSEEKNAEKQRQTKGKRGEKSSKVGQNIKEGLSEVIANLDNNGKKASKSKSLQHSSRTVERLKEKLNISKESPKKQTSKDGNLKLGDQNLDLEGKSFNKLAKKATEGIQNLIKKAVDGSLRLDEIDVSSVRKKVEKAKKQVSQIDLSKILKSQDRLAEAVSMAMSGTAKKGTGNAVEGKADSKAASQSKVSSEKTSNPAQNSGSDKNSRDVSRRRAETRRGSREDAKQRQRRRETKQLSERQTQTADKKQNQKSSTAKNAGIKLSQGDVKSLVQTGSIEGRLSSGRQQQQRSVASNLRFSSARQSSTLKHSQQAQANGFARRLEMAVNNQGGEASFSVRTESGDQMKVQVKVQNGRTDVVFKSDNPAMKQRLERTLNQLRQSLEKAGFSEGDVDIQSEVSRQRQQNSASREELREQKNAIASGAEGEAGEDIAPQESEGINDESHVVEGRIYVVA